jgi:hypothetical protein
VCVRVCVCDTYTHTHNDLLLGDALEFVLIVCLINEVRDEAFALQRERERERERERVSRERERERERERDSATSYIYYSHTIYNNTKKSTFQKLVLYLTAPSRVC